MEMDAEYFISKTLKQIHKNVNNSNRWFKLNGGHKMTNITSRPGTDSELKTL